MSCSRPSLEKTPLYFTVGNKLKYCRVIQDIFPNHFGGNFVYNWTSIFDVEKVLANTLSVEFAAQSFFFISPEIKKTDSRRRMYLGDPRRRGLPTVRYDGAAIESTAVK